MDVSAAGGDYNGYAEALANQHCCQPIGKYVVRVNAVKLMPVVEFASRSQTSQEHQKTVQGHGDSRPKKIARMVDPKLADSFCVRNGAEGAATSISQQFWQVGDGSNNLDKVSGSSGQMRGSLENENPRIRGHDIGEEASEGQHTHGGYLCIQGT